MSYINRVKYLMCERILRCDDLQQLENANRYLNVFIVSTDRRTDSELKLKKYLELSSYKDKLLLTTDGYKPDKT